MKVINSIKKWFRGNTLESALENSGKATEAAATQAKKDVKVTFESADKQKKVEDMNI